VNDHEHDWSWSNEESRWIPPNVDLNKASVARMYDQLIGGKDNFPIDEKACEALEAIAPSTRALSINNRRFLQRAVRYLAEEEGIRQFIDHGSGLPTQNNVHQIAQGVDPQARVVYIDNDPIVLAHGRALLADNDRTAFIQADMQDTDAILNHPDARPLLNFDEPLGVLYVSVLHCLSDAAEPAAVVRRLLDRLAPGSFVVVSHLVSDDRETRDSITKLMLDQTGGQWGRVRTTAEVKPWFDGFEFVPPGLVEASQWRPTPDDRPQETMEWHEFAGVARKPRT